MEEDGYDITIDKQTGKVNRIEKENKIYEENNTINGKEATWKNPTIPAGFRPVLPSQEAGVGDWGDGTKAIAETEINKGLVIEDKEHNQFVWVPVPKPIGTVQVDGNAELNDINSTPMAEIVSTDDQTVNYRGVLYDSWKISTEASDKRTVNFATDTTNAEDWIYYEPDVAINYNEDITIGLNIIKDILGNQDEKNNQEIESKYESKDTFKETMQKDFNDMVQSVSKYGGFYIARYEMSLDSGIAKSKKGVVAASAGEDSGNTWYGLYAYSKKMAIGNNYKNAKTHMIWGCQYDAMLNWMARSDVDILTPRSEFYRQNTDYITGKFDRDKFNNIFDFLGCRYNWSACCSDLRNNVQQFYSCVRCCTGQR